MERITLESNITISAVFFFIVTLVCSVLILKEDVGYIGYLLVTFIWILPYILIYKKATNMYISHGSIQINNFLTIYHKKYEYFLKDIQWFKCYYSGGGFSEQAVIIYFKDGTKKKFKVSVPIKKLKEFSEKLRGLGFEVEYSD